MKTEAINTGDKYATARLVASYVLSLSLFALATSLAYFTYEFSTLSRYIPDVLVSINNTTDKVEPVVAEVGRITVLVPAILQEVEATRNVIPPILKEVELTRKQIPAVLKEVEMTRKQIPAVLKQVEAVREDVPAMLASADRASDAVVAISKEVAATRPLIPDVLKEVQMTRESIPPMMDRADRLIEKARVAGKEASQGAVTGIFSGIIMAPFALVADVGRGITGMTAEEAKVFDERDFDLIKQGVIDLLNNGSEGDERKWRNKESGNNGIIKLSGTYSEGEFAEYDCRTLSIELYKKDKLIKETSRSFCKNDENQWDFDE